MPPPDRHVHAFTAMPVPRFTLDPPPAHTAFTVIFCACGHAEIFPVENFLLATPVRRAAFARHLAIEYGLTLHAPLDDET